MPLLREVFGAVGLVCVFVFVVGDMVSVGNVLCGFVSDVAFVLGWLCESVLVGDVLFVYGNYDEMVFEYFVMWTFFGLLSLLLYGAVVSVGEGCTCVVAVAVPCALCVVVDVVVEVCAVEGGAVF